MNQNADFSSGVAVYFRMLIAANTLAVSMHPRGRAVQLRHNKWYDDDYVVVDENNAILGVYPRDFVSAILPIQTIGPADAPNPPK